MGVQWRISLVRNPQVRRRSGRKQQPSHPAASKHELHGYSANRVADPCRREALLQVTAVSASTLLGQASWNLNKQGNSAHAAAVKVCSIVQSCLTITSHQRYSLSDLPSYAGVILKENSFLETHAYMCTSH